MIRRVTCSMQQLVMCVRLCLVTSRRVLARDMKFCDILLVDEIHIGSKDNTIIIALWMEARRQGKFVPNLIASTATDHGLEELKMKIGGVVFENDFRHFKVGLRYQ